LSRFASFDTQEYDAIEVLESANNSRHIQFTAQNANWIFNEMQGTPIANSCLYTCSSANPVIAGPNTICGSNAIFTVSGLPSGSIPAWSNSSNISYIAGQGTSAYTVVRGSVSGNGYVSVGVSGACGPRPNPTQKTVRVGGFSSTDYPVFGPSTLCTNSFGYYNTNDLPGATNYAWFWPNDWTYSGGQGTRYLSLMSGSTMGGGAVGVRVANVCDAGGSPGSKYTQVSSCGGYMVTTFPNPAEDQLTIEVTSEDSADSTASNGSATQNKNVNVKFSVKLLNASGEIKRSGVGVNGTLILNILDLPTGLYYLIIETEKETLSQQIVVK